MTAIDHPPTDGIGNPLVELRWAAEHGYLPALADEPGVRAAAYQLVHTLTFERHTRKIELRRRHFACARSFTAMPQECLDRFHEDVEAVRNHLMRTTDPITNVEGFVVKRMRYAVIEGYRARRGAIGASHKGNVPDGLARMLDDGWLIELAHLMLIWVGLPTTAGISVWPTESWAEQRARHVVDSRDHDPAGVERDIEEVLAVMEEYSVSWTERYVHRPLDAKPIAVADEPHDRPDPVALSDDEALVQAAAADAVAYVRAALRAGANPDAAARRALAAFAQWCRTDSDDSMTIWFTPERIEQLVPVIVAIVVPDLDG